MDAVINRDLIEDKLQKMKAEARKKSEKNNNRVTQPFQTLGLELAEKLNDKKHTALYIKIAKSRSRYDIDAALQFISDSNANSKAKLFMWKLKQLKGAR